MAAKQEEVAAVTEKMNAPTFWDDQDSAQATVAELQKLNTVVKPLEELTSAAEDLKVLIELADEEDSAEAAAEVSTTLKSLEPRLAKVELQAIMSDPADSCAAYLKVQAGEGGTDAADWAEMLMRMYLRWAEQKGLKAELLERSDGEEAGIRNATLLIHGSYTFGYLKGENGNHRLIRISPFDSAGRRQTSFAAVDVTPEIGEEIEIDIDWAKDVKEDTYRASGAGGQHVNKTDSAIRLTHLPSGEVVQCQSQRSQHKNRAQARKMLTAKLYQLESDKRDAEVAARRGEKSKIGFGGETARNYVLHPDQFVKDTRTGHKAGNPQTVLDGDLDPFLESHLRWRIGQD